VQSHGTDQDEARQETAQDGAEEVHRVEAAEVRPQLDLPSGEETEQHRQGAAHQHGGDQQEQGRAKEPRRHEALPLRAQGVHRPEIALPDPGQQGRLDQGEEPDAPLHGRIAAQQVGTPVRHPAESPRPQGQATHEHRQHHAQGRGRGAHQQAQLPGPEDLVGEGRRSGKQEQGIEQPPGEARGSGSGRHAGPGGGGFPGGGWRNPRTHGLPLGSKEASIVCRRRWLSPPSATVPRAGRSR